MLATITLGVLRNADELIAPAPQTTPLPALPDDGVPMIAVLPFAHLGSNEEGEFFAAGVHDDLLTSLSNIGTIRVVSRTSVLEYANTTKLVPQIAKELGASAILEGGIRIMGGQIRMNAQLIDAKTDEHLWAETFDRPLTAESTFTVQTEIARAITLALRTTLSAHRGACRHNSKARSGNIGAADCRSLLFLLRAA